jgi:hypothetical protein
MEINYEELKKQYREDIIASGEYIECNILIAKNSNEPFTDVKVRKVSSMEVAELLVCFDELKKAFAKKDPIAFQIYKSGMFSTKTDIITNDKPKDDDK